MEPKASSSIAKFAVRFCNELGNSKTTVCSPMCAESVLALLALGCQNDTRAELLRALDFPDNETLKSSFGYVTSALNSIEGATLNIANKVYLKKDGSLKAGIKKDAEEVFKSSLEQLDFNEKEAAADAINKWVEEKTNKKIINIVSPDMFGELTALVLVNAIYFQATWKITFNKRYTTNRNFHINNTTQINVSTMLIREKYFNYKDSKDLNAQILQMDYNGCEASMVIVLPKEIEGLGEVMKKLADGHDLMAEIETLRETKVLVNMTIPKFKVEMMIDLKELLPKLGIKSIFDPVRADIDMLTTNEKLYVSKAIQKAFIAVDELGTEAAACSTLEMIPYCRRFPKHFTADRPFLYALIVRNIPLFIGIYEGSEYHQPEHLDRALRVKTLSRFVAREWGGDAQRLCDHHTEATLNSGFSLMFENKFVLDGAYN